MKGVAVGDLYPAAASLNIVHGNRGVLEMGHHIKTENAVLEYRGNIVDWHDIIDITLAGQFKITLSCWHNTPPS